MHATTCLTEKATEPSKVVFAAMTADSSVGEWYAIHTRARHEKKIACILAKRHLLETFVPTVRQLHDWSDRRKAVDVPLFSSYVFVQVWEWQRAYQEVLRTPGVFRWVGYRAEPTAIPTSQIESIRKAITSRAAASPYPFLKIGQRVRIRGGCLDGVEGVLAGAKGDRRLVISVDLIQQSMAIVVEGYEVVPA